MISISQLKLTQVFNRLFSWIGTFWSKIYTDPNFIKHIQVGRSLRVAQLYLDLLENLKLMDRRNIPVLHRERWYPIIIRKNEEGTGALNALRLGPQNHATLGPQDKDPEDPTKDSVYGVGTELHIGTAAEYVDVEVYPIHGKIDSVVTCIVDSIVNPKTVLRKGTDFIIGDNCIGIYKSHSPFGANSTFPQFEVIETGQLEVVLWGCDAVIDKDYVNDYLGYVIGAAVQSTETGKNIVNSYWDMVNYANPQYLSELLGNLCHVPFVKEDGEKIETVLENAVITDRNVYRFDEYTPDYRTKIAPGAVMKRGEYFDQSIKILPFLTDTSREMEYDPEEVLPNVYIPSAITSGGIGFSVDWSEMQTNDFVTKYSDLLDIEEEKLREVCIAAGNSDTIIPAKFFLENVIGANTLFIVLDSSKIKDAQIYKPIYSKLVGETVPKYIRVVIRLALDIDNEDDTTNTNDVTEDIKQFWWKGIDEQTESSWAEETVSNRLVSGCARL